MKDAEDVKIKEEELLIRTEPFQPAVPYTREILHVLTNLMA
jgi:hypothetical protein